jgi:uncharacterized membrane protein
VSSKAQPGGRPLHPVLVPFPLVLLFGAFLADAAGAALGVAGLWMSAWYVRGAVGVPPDPALLLIEGVAAVLLGTGAWFGRRLARRVDATALAVAS